MTDTLVREPGASSPAPRRAAPRRKPLVPVLLQLGAMIGLGLLLYPTAANWFATLTHNSEVSGYVRQVEALPDEVKAERLELARQYNQTLPPGLIRDPYLPLDDEGEQAANAAYEIYQQLLGVSETGVIGQLSYPRLGIGLPVFHGTADDTLAKGVGHLYGSSLPVGGPSTHSVLTSHSGQPHAELFTPLHKAEVGDVFQIAVLGETLYYQVEGIETVLPEERDSLTVVDGEDRVTLFTCTPIGINSHRLLLHAVRIPAPPAESGDGMIAGDGLTAGFPWWAVAFVGGSAVLGYVLFAPPRSGSPKVRDPRGGSSRRARSSRRLHRHGTPRTDTTHPGITPTTEETRS